MDDSATGNDMAPLHDHRNGDGSVVTATKLDQPGPIAVHGGAVPLRCSQVSLNLLDKALSCRCKSV
jgi:hypothetical protein